MVCLIFILGIFITAYCQEKSTLQLKDGSKIEGEVIASSNGIYTFKANTASNTNTTTSVNPSSLPTAEIDRIKTKMLSNPEAMKAATELANDPQFQEILKDPRVINAAKTGNIRELMTNQKLQGLANNPKIEKIRSELDEKKE